MQLTLSDGAIARIKWRHEHINGSEPIGHFKGVPYRGITTCVVEISGDWLELIGYSYCSMQDNFSKGIGRKLSLTHAVWRYSKETRTAIWKAYLGRGGK